VRASIGSLVNRLPVAASTFVELGAMAAFTSGLPCPMLKAAGPPEPSR